MTCRHCEYEEAYLYDLDGFEVFRIGKLLYFTHEDKECCMEIIYCPFCGEKLRMKRKFIDDTEDWP